MHQLTEHKVKIGKAGQRCPECQIHRIADFHSISGFYTVFTRCVCESSEELLATGLDAGTAWTYVADVNHQAALKVTQELGVRNKRYEIIARATGARIAVVSEVKSEFDARRKYLREAQKLREQVGLTASTGWTAADVKARYLGPVIEQV